MGNNRRKVSIIIVTYNCAAVIGDCLRALAAQTFTNFEIIVVDNDSQDDTLAVVRPYHPDILVATGENSGFTGGNIEGLRHASGDYIVLLNPDTECVPRWLEFLVAAMDGDSRTGICASKLLVAGNGLIDSAGDGCTTTGRGFKRGEGLRSPSFDQPEYVFGACGGAMMIRREMIDDIGFLEKSYFLIHEDTDYNFRAQLAGWKCLYVPQAVVYHKVSTSIGRLSDTAVYYSLRNSRYVLALNMPLRLFLRYLHHHLLQEIGVFIYFVFKHRKGRGYCRANWDFLTAWPRLMVIRRQRRMKVRLSAVQLQRKLTPVWNASLLFDKCRKLFCADR
ncbi:MAG TPA: glycosyltransferase family 2 protein [Patescibacteria group bacterium]|nr:glycosyltransferase family 2 protein [Patescibacteria group bacterium]